MKLIDPVVLMIIAIAFIAGSCSDNGDELKKKKKALKEIEAERDPNKIYLEGAEIYFKKMGSGEPLIVIHGGPGLNHSYFLPQLEELANHYEVYFYDQRGSGKSFDNLDTSTINMDQFVKDIEEIRNHFLLDKVHILGHSWGGLLAMKYAVGHSRFIKSMILVNPLSPDPEVKVEEDSQLSARDTEEDLRELEEIKNSEAYKNQEAGAYERMFRVFFRKEFYDKSYADSLSIEFPDNFASSSAVLGKLAVDKSAMDISGSLEEITCPTLLIFGEYDPLEKIAGEILRKNIPNSYFAVMKETGHFPFVEKKDKFIELILDFRNSLNRSKSEGDESIFGGAERMLVY